jgi:hypothetical protein
MSAQAFHAIATQFRDRYLHPLQFRRSNTIEDRVGALENSRRGQDTSLHTEPKPGTDEHFDHVMARSAEALKRTSYAAGNVEEATHAQRMKRSGDILQNIRNTAAEHRAAAPLPEERHADSMSRTGELLDSIRRTQAVSDAHAPGTVPAPRPTPAPQRVVQAGLFGPSQVRAPQQFGLAATEGPRPQGKPTMSAPRGPRVTQPGLFPKSAVKKSRGFPPHREIG